jgi:hypothetical protein
MPANNFIQGVFQYVVVYTTFQAEQVSGIIGQVGWIKLVEKPKTLLRKRKRSQFA